MAKNVLNSVMEMVTPLCEENGCFLYDVEFQKEGKNQILRIYVDKDGGINIDECETVSRLISKKLDDEDIIANAYQLEVSSPGAERKLTKDWHFKKVLGKQIEVSLYAPLDGKKTITGVLESFTSEEITILENGCGIPLPKDKIASAKLYFDINEVLKAKS